MFLKSPESFRRIAFLKHNGVHEKMFYDYRIMNKYSREPLKVDLVDMLGLKVVYIPTNKVSSFVLELL